MAIPKVPAPSSSSQDIPGNLIRFLISAVECVERIQEKKFEEFAPLTVDEVLDRIARAS